MEWKTEENSEEKDQPEKRGHFVFKQPKNKEQEVQRGKERGR